MGEVRIRSFRSGDAPGAVTLRRILRAEEVLTEEGLLYWRRAAPKRTHTRWWAALDERDVVGWANAGLMNWTKQEDLADLWVGVHPERRGKGIGGRLFELANAHVGQLAPRKIYTVVRQGDRTATRFASKRGFTKVRTSKVWQLDPRKVDLSDLPDRIAEKRAGWIQAGKARRTQGAAAGFLRDLPRRRPWNPIRRAHRH